MDTISTAMGPGGALPAGGGWKAGTRLQAAEPLPAGQFRLLVDLRWMGRANADLAAMKVAFEVLQKGFPERLSKIWLAEPPA